MKIGILGGSFDPAHKGHIYISNMAIKILDLNQIWWLVASQNPLKNTEQRKSLNRRLESAINIKKNHKIRPLALEESIGTLYSHDTLTTLKKKMPGTKMFWIIGADNLYNMHKWYKWKKLFYICPIIVFNRPGYFYKSLSSKAAKYYWKKRVNIKYLRKFSYKNLPVWSFVHNSYDFNSSSEIRSYRKELLN